MPTIDGKPVPDPLLEQLRSMPALSSPESLLLLGEMVPRAMRGFRRTSPKAPDAVRRYVLQQLDGTGALDERTLLVLAEGSPCLEVVSPLSRLLLAQYAPELMAVFGRLPFIASLLVDYRPEVRRLAADLYEETPKTDLPSADEAGAVLRDHIVPVAVALLDAIGVRPPDARREGDEPPGEEAGTDAVATELGDAYEELNESATRIESLEARIRELEEHCRNEKTLRRKTERLTAVNEALRTRLQQAERQVAAAHKARDEARAATASAEARARDLEARMDATLAERMGREIRAEVNRWLADARNVEAAAQDEKTDLLDRARAAVARQRERDRHVGNLATLRARTADLQQVISEIRRLQADAFHPLAELRPLEAQIESEVARLCELTGDRPAEASPFVQRMLARINAAQTEDDVAAIGRMLDDINGMQALPATDLLALYERYHDRMFRSYAAHIHGIRKTPYQPNDPVWSLANAVDRNEPMAVVLDGHNILHCLPEVFAPSYDERGEPGQAAREHLVNLSVGLFNGAPQCRVDVFFDGPIYAARNAAVNVREVYSGGGQAEHRADEAIMRHMEHCSVHMSALPKLLVSDDRKLREDASRLGARVMSVPQFGAFVARRAQS